jgi:TP901 family phage tail tape measure protein
LNKAIAQLNKAIADISNTKVDLNEAPIIADMNKIQAEAKQTGDAIDKSLSGGTGNAVEGLKGKFGGLGDMFGKLGAESGGLGNAFQSLSGGVTGLVPGLGSLTGVLATGGIAAGIAAVGGSIAYSVDKGKEFESQLASLSSITGVSGDGLADLGEKAKVMASKFGTDASANIDAFKTILSKLGPDIAKSPEALNSMAESVNTLSKATGDDPGKATEALTGALLQFGVSLDDPKKAADAMATAMNVLAAGAKEGASEVPEVAAAINVAGVAASKSKVSFEETNSALQILAAGGKVGSEAGTSLRNVLNKLGEGRFLPKDTAKELKAAGVDINKLGDTSISFSERLRELNKVSSDAALTTKLFGTDAAAASILIKGANGSMDELTKKLTGTSTAYDQAAINMATFDESLNRIKSNIDNFAISFYDGMKMSFGMLAESTGPAVSELMTNMGGYFERMWSVVQPILGALAGVLMVGISNAINIAVEAVNAFFEMAVYAFDGVINALRPLTDAIKSALGMDGAAGEGIDVMKLLQDVMNTMGTVISAVFDVLQTLGKIIIDVVVGAFSNTIKVIVAVGEMFAAFGRWIGELIMKIPGIKSVFDGLKSGFDSVYNFFANLPKVINEVQIYLKAVGGTFTSVFNILGQAFNDALNLDFGKAAEKLGSVFQSQTWVKAFSDNLNTARNELKATSEVAKKTGDEFKKFQTDTDTGGGGGGGGGGNKDDEEKKKEQTTLDKRRDMYRDYLQKLQNDRNTYEIGLQGSEEEKSRLLKQRLEADNELAKIKLNELARETKDTKFEIESIKIKAEQDESIEDVKEFYISEFKKLQDQLDKNKAKVKPDLSWRDQVISELETFVKDADGSVKEYAKNLESMFKAPVNTEGQFAKAEQDFTNFNDMLISQQQEVQEKIQLARDIGDTKSLAALEKLRESNQSTLDDMYRRFARFSQDSEKAISENTVFFQVAKSLELSIQEAFNADKLRTEIDAERKARDEKLNALNQQESDLKNSLAKREISFEEYSSKISQIEKEKSEASQNIGQQYLGRLKRAGDQAAASVFKSQAEVFNKNAEGLEGNQKIFNQFVGETLSSFGELAASGKATLEDFGKAAAGAAFDAVSKMIPSFVAGILGNSVTTLGPILGPLAAATLTGTLYGLLGLARSAAGFKDGVVALDGVGTETSDSIPAWLSKGESVITARATKNNLAELEFMNKTGKSISEFYLNKVPMSSYSVSNNGEIVEEIKKLRDETRNLGTRISRNTRVEVSGVLSGDSRGIRAIVDSERKRNMRRG